MTAEREIGGVLYACDKLPAEPALKLFLKSSKVLRAASGLLEAVILDGTNLDVIHAFFDFIEKMDTDEVHKLVMELAALPKADAKPGDILALFQVAQFALEVNFRDFLSENLSNRTGSPTSEAEAASA